HRSYSEAVITPLKPRHPESVVRIFAKPLYLPRHPNECYPRHGRRSVVALSRTSPSANPQSAVPPLKLARVCASRKLVFRYRTLPRSHGLLQGHPPPPPIAQSNF